MSYGIDDEGVDYSAAIRKSQIVPGNETLVRPFRSRQSNAIVPLKEISRCPGNYLESFVIPHIVPDIRFCNYIEQIFIIDDLTKLTAIDNDNLLFKAITNEIVIVYCQYNFDDTPFERPYSIGLMVQTGELFLFNLYNLGEGLPNILQLILGNELIVKLGFNLFFNECKLMHYYGVNIRPRLDIRQLLQLYPIYSGLDSLNIGELINRFAPHIKVFELSGGDDMLGFDSITYIKYLKILIMGIYVSTQNIFGIDQSQDLQLSIIKNTIPQIETVIHTNLKLSSGSTVYILQ
jgi:hypothetical protein